MKPLAFIMLVHQARSHVYCGLVKQYCDRQDIKLLVISSDPISDEHKQKVQKHADRSWFIPVEDLTRDNLASALTEARAEFDILGVLATYEGYRVAMAQINAELGVFDAKPEKLAACMDKYTCRKTLYQEGLSSVDCHILSDQNLAQLKAGPGQYFVKPRRGIGSFACFKLKDDLRFDVIEAYQQEMQTDLRFKNLFAGQLDFLAEEFIDGDEYSFEVIVFDGKSTVVGTHAKYISDLFGTTLETGTTLPAQDLSDAEQKTGEEFVDKCLQALNLEQGAYHIETRYDRKNQVWNIIEINARMGGALINQSVEVFTGQYAFLELWVLSLINRSVPQREAFQQVLNTLRESTRRRENSIEDAAIFISQYGEPGRTIKRLSAEMLLPQPYIYEPAVSEGSVLPNSTRGIFLFNALWKVDSSRINQELHELHNLVENDLILEYETV